MLTYFSNVRKSYISWIFSLCSIIILQLSFNYNIFDAVTDSVYKEYENDASEGLVVGKLINSRYYSIFNNTVLGFYGESTNQYNLYLNNINPINETKFLSYDSSFGLQGYIYSIIENTLSLLNIKAIDKLHIMIFLTSLTMAVILTIFINTVKNEFGLFSALTLLTSIVYSQWLVLFAKDIYWMFFLILLPFVYSWVSLQSEQLSNSKYDKIYFIISFLIFLKCLAGFEYISTIFVSILIPFVYFSIKNNWGILIFLKRSLLLYFYAILGFISSIIFYLFQKVFLLGGFSNAFYFLLHTIKKRTTSNPEGLEPILKESINSSLWDVLLKYWNGKAFDLHSILGKYTFITFGDIVIYFIFITILFLSLYKLNFLINSLKKKQIGLLLATWFSILAPFSWYILAKPHSYIHDFFNQVLWHVPFVLLVFIFSAYLIVSINYKKLTIKFYSILLIIIIITLYIYSKKNEYEIENLLENSIEIYKSDKITSILLNHKKNQLIYLYKDCQKETLNTTFFLHFYPYDSDLLAPIRKEYQFDNMDFFWTNFQVETALLSKYKNFCIAIKDLPIYSIKSINTGQIDLWETKLINLDTVNYIKNSDVIPYDLTDSTWVNGIHSTGGAFFIENNFINNQSIRVGDKLIFNFSGMRIIKSISYNKKSINIEIYNGNLDPIKDGYPNKIKIIREVQK